MPEEKPPAATQGFSCEVGPRQTRQREVILQVLHDARCPLLIREIHARARGVNRPIGMATVYRTLKVLYESGQIRMVHWPSGRAFYRQELTEPPDCFECRGCRKFFVLDACSLCLSQRQRSAGNFVVQSCQVILRGLCPGCAPKG